MKGLWSCAFLIPISAWLGGSSFAGDSSAGEERIGLEPKTGEMSCIAKVPGLGSQVLILGIPETIGGREAMILNFPEVKGKLEWSGPDGQGAYGCEWTTDKRIRYTARLVPGDDYVDVEMTIENLGETLWHDVWASNCLNPMNAEEFKDWNLERTYMSSGGVPLLMSKTTRVKGPVSKSVGFYTHEQCPWGQESPFVRGFGAISPDRTDGSWIITLSDPPGSYMAATSLGALYLFDNLDRCCLHSAPSFGDIGPGESSFTVARYYFAKGGLSDFLKRYEKDRKALASRQKWARPKRERIKVEGINPPREGFGTLGFKISAPWMKGTLEQRFPETLHSSLGLHFIDHDRKDMPPLGKLGSAPKWTTENETGEISYVAQAPGGLNFSGRVRPYEEEIVLEFRVKNKTEETVRNVYPQMCLSMKESDDFNRKHDVEPEFGWFSGKSAPLSETTPTAADKGRKPWLLIDTVDAPESKASREHPDGWWMVDQKADIPVLARASGDNQHLVAVYWENATRLMTNTNIPCLHSGPAGHGSLAPGEEAVWRGKIYLMPNKPDQLLIRYKGDSGQWPYSK